jgi:hypothetical protein
MRPIYLTIFAASLTTLTYQILLTRVFSVAMWYHYAFMAISVAMFGLTVGALLVYLRPRYFDPERVRLRVGQWSLYYGIAMLTSFVFFMAAPVSVITETAASLEKFFFLGIIYFILSLPFIFSGVVITLCLTQFPQHVSRLYAADLVGAALGTIAFMVMLVLFDAPSAVFVLAGFAVLPALLVGGSGAFGLRSAAALVAGFCIGAGLVNGTFAIDGNAPFRLVNEKSSFPEAPLYEEWNSYSRVSVHAMSSVPGVPFGWGFGGNFPAVGEFEQRMLLIDSGAGTPLTKFDGDLGSVEYLRYDISNLPHHLRSEADVMVVGAGGGRDVLSGFLFEQERIVAAEINDAIIAVTTDVYPDYIGNIMSDPRVEIVNDEARSFLSRTDEEFDIIQISLIDTWAATAAGAFVLSENTLYTTEAWQLFFARLREQGVLSVSRWYFPEQPSEMYRMVGLGAEALRQRGVEEPRLHLMVYRTPDRNVSASSIPHGVATLLVSPEPFSEEDVTTLEAVAEQYGFVPVLTPTFATDENLVTLTEPERPTAFYDAFPLDITPPTDDRPFFFHMLRPSDFLDSFDWEGDPNAFNLKAVSTLLTLLLVTVVFAVSFIVIPLLLSLRHSFTKETIPFVLYFIAIGLGFIIVEIALLQQLVIFLGHPVYSLSVVLFSLLLASGIGSFLTSRIPDDLLLRFGHRGITFIIAAGVIIALALPWLITASSALPQPARILQTVVVVMSLGALLGVAFPVGMRLAQLRIPTLSPFLWGVNGAMSVVASVLAIVISLSFGIATTFLVGVACYGLALVSLRFMSGAR